MIEKNSYVYFVLKGDDFNPDEITSKIGINPTNTWSKGDKGKYKPKMGFACWELATGKENIEIDKLVNEVVDKLYEKIEIITELKSKYNLLSVLEIVLFIDMNQDESTPSMGHDLKCIEFLYKTMTTTDVDIYTYNSEAID
jgi:Domain of unknown function (DUF4279)